MLSSNYEITLELAMRKLLDGEKLTSDEILSFSCATTEEFKRAFYEANNTKLMEDNKNDKGERSKNFRLSWLAMTILREGSPVIIGDEEIKPLTIDEVAERKGLIPSNIDKISDDSKKL